MKLDRPVPRTRPAPAGWAPAFLSLSLIWGASFALIKVAVDAGVSPLWVALWRCAAGAATLAVLCAARRHRLPTDRATWGHALVVAALLNSAPFALLAFGEQRVDSVLAGVVNATTPLLTLAFAVVVVPQERLTAPRVVGLVVGFLGVLVVLGAWHLSGRGDVLVGSLACLGATTCYGAGFAYTRRFFSGRPGSPKALSLLQVFCASVQLALAAGALRVAPTWPGWGALVALLVLGGLGTGYAFVLNLRVIQAAGPTLASTVTYVVPLWSTLIGAVFLAEPVAWNTVAGALLIVAGIVTARAPGERLARLFGRGSARAARSPAGDA